VENTTSSDGRTERMMKEQRVRAPPHSNDVVGKSSSSGGEGEGGRDRDIAGDRCCRHSSGPPEGSSALLPKGQQHRQRLSRSNSDQPILGRVDYKAVKRDLR